MQNSVEKFQYLLLRDGTALESSCTAWGISDRLVLPGESMTRNFGESPNVVVESRLSSILEDNPPQKYYLSPKACMGLLTRATRGGKELPAPLLEALKNQLELGNPYASETGSHT